MPKYFTLQNTNDTAIVSGDLLGQLQFSSSADSDAGDAIKITAAISAEAEGTFTSSANPAAIVFSTGPSSTATGQLKITNSGHFVPLTNEQKDLGEPANKFRNLYVTGIVFGDNTIQNTASTGGGGGMTSWTIADGSGNSEAISDAETLYISGAGSVSTTFNGTTNVVTISGSAAGGAGTPGGSTTQFQYNNAGSFGGTAGVTYEATAGTGTLFRVHGTGNETLFIIDYTGENTETTISIYRGTEFDTANLFEIKTESSGDLFIVDYTGNITGPSYSMGAITGTVFRVHGLADEDLLKIEYTGIDSPTVVSIYRSSANDTGNILQINTESGVTLYSINTSGKMYETASYSKVQHTGSAASHTFNLDESNIFTATLSSTTSSVSIQNGNVGQRFLLRLENGVTSGNVTSWFSNINWPGGITPTGSPGIGEVNLWGFLTYSGNGGTLYHDGFLIATGL